MQEIRLGAVKLILTLSLSPFLLGNHNSITITKLGKCQRVVDGDTIIFDDGSNTYRIRMAYIDAPEISQRSYDNYKIGAQSKLFLKRLIEFKNVKIKFLDKGRYGRHIGVVFLDKININLKMLEAGWAINLDQKHRSFITKAMINSKGVWEYDGFDHPRFYRKKKASY